MIKPSNELIRGLLAFTLCSFSLLATAQEPEIEEVVVLSPTLGQAALGQNITELAGNQLVKQLQSSLGETLAGEMGVHSANFGAAVGRPIIHGLSGARVKLTEGRLDSLDASVSSPDHTVGIEPFIARNISVVKGASSLLYGSGAIGGVVNVDTGRIPTALPEHGYAGRLLISGSDNASRRTAAASFDASINSNFAAHIDAFNRKANNYKTSHKYNLFSEEPLDNNKINGSHYDNNGGAFGLSFIDDKGFTGLSISKLNADYGLLSAHEHEEDGHGDDHDEDHDEGHDDHDEGHDDHDNESTPTLVLKQTKYNLKSAVNNPVAGISKVDMRIAVNDYEHQEIESNLEVASTFTNKAWDSRFELHHEALMNWIGVVGLQFSGRDFSGLGEEVFLPLVESNSQGLFWVGRRQLQQLEIEIGGRVENHKYQPVAKAQDSFSNTSGSLGFVWNASDKLDMALQLDHSNRAPTIEELYSNGAHLATKSFEKGDQNLSNETVSSISLSTDFQTDAFSVLLNLYQLSFSDFIYQQKTGEIQAELPVFAYTQADATFQGLDAEIVIQLASNWQLTLMHDRVTAKLTDSGEYLPRIPASRYRANLQWGDDTQNISATALRVLKQSKQATFEDETAAYSDIAITANKQLQQGRNQWNLFLKANNLTNQLQFEHQSFVKSFAPRTGRTVEIGATLVF